MRSNSIGKTCKRICDLTGAFIAVTVFSPVMVIVGLTIWLTMGKPIIFRQVRPGQHGNSFTLFKFRTMGATQSLTIDPSNDAARLTKVGIALRRFSLDELPQLWNVMKPGIIGLAQVKGRNAITWEEKFVLDVWYVDHWNFWLDVQILLLTVEKVLRREGINQQGH